MKASEGEPFSSVSSVIEGFPRLDADSDGTSDHDLARRGHEHVGPVHDPPRIGLVGQDIDRGQVLAVELLVELVRGPGGGARGPSGGRPPTREARRPRARCGSPAPRSRPRPASPAGPWTQPPRQPLTHRREPRRAGPIEPFRQARAPDVEVVGQHPHGLGDLGHGQDALRVRATNGAVAAPDLVADMVQRHGRPHQIDRAKPSRPSGSWAGGC